MLFALVTACFALSGFSALIYQVAWLRLFAISFGTSEIAVGIVLAGYMAGLAIGAAVAARYANKVRRPVLVYGLLEAAIAISAIAMPWLVGLSGDAYALFAGGQDVPPDAGSFGQLFYYAAFSLLILLVPTAFMGATLPLLARYAVTTDRQLGPRVGLLYALNTVGAVAGAAAAGFVLMPALGLANTVLVGVVVNFAVFVIAVIVAKVAPGAGGPAAAVRAASSGAPRFKFLLPLMLLSGAVSFMYEILWMRMLSHVLGSSVYAFATMLSAFLAGIAIGAGLSAPVARKPETAALLFAGTQFGIAISSALVFIALPYAVQAGIADAWLAFAILVPSTIFIGATYPLAVRAYASTASDVAWSAGRIYAWNTVGAVIGALAGGFLVVPGLGFGGAIRLGVAGNLVIGIVAVLLLPVRRRHAVAVVVTALAALTLFQPQRPDAVVAKTIFGGSGGTVVREVFFSVGRSSTVWLTENQARFDLSSNGLPEAQVEFHGAPPVILSQRWLGLWPSLIRPQTESVLVVGLGGGVVLESVPASVTTLHVAELEQDILAANQAIASRRYADPLSRAGLHVAINDARNALRLVSRKYDAIVSQPSHPWTAGASHLFTREFVALAKDHLNDDGVFVQWMNAEFLDENLLGQLAATLLAEFDHVRVYQPSSLALHFVASDQPLGDPAVPAEKYSHNGINSVLDITAALLMDEAAVREIARGHGPVTDDNNRMAMDSNVRAAGLGNAALARIVNDIDPLLNADSPARMSLDETGIAYVVSRLLYGAQESRASNLVASVDDEGLQKVLSAMVSQYRGDRTRAQQLLRQVDSDHAVYGIATFLGIEGFPPEAGHCGVTRTDGANDGSLAAVLTGWCLFAASDWPALERIDARLAATAPRQLWFPHANWLRATWRLKSADPGNTLALEALQLVDHAVALSPMPVLYAARAEAALKQALPAHEIESIAFFVRAVDDRLWTLDYQGDFMSREERDWVAEQLRGFDVRLRVLQDGDVTGRASVVHSEVTDLQKYFGSY